MTPSPTDENLILRITAYGFHHKKFTLLQLRENLTLNPDEYKFLARHLTLKSRTKQASPNHLIGVLTFKLRKEVSETDEDKKRGLDFADDTNDYERTTYMLLSSAYFSYIDHLEVVEARKNAKSARTSANWALGISIAAFVVSLLLGLWQVVLTKEANAIARDAVESSEPPPPNPEISL